MYIWIGCRLPRHFEEEIRSLCLEKNEALGLDAAAFSLPQHISLKISFPTDRAEAVLEELNGFFSAQASFSVEILEIEQKGNLLWLTVGENATLQQLHENLDERLKTQFGIEQHPFDTCFQFHSTLFMDPDVEKVSKMKGLLADFALPRTLIVESILLGVSHTGKPGTYRVEDEIILS